jgi:hypothetical protein
MTDAITPKVKSVENMVERARNATRDPRSPACPVCHVKMWISLFFDGTGNHRDRDFPIKHSNIAALYDAHLNDPEGGVVPLYYEGLGRAFSFKERYEKVKVPARGGYRVSERKGYEESDDRWLGKGFADGITERLEKALFEVTDVIQNQRRRTRVDEINLAVFGFSRGATEARAFLHWLSAHSKVRVQGKSMSFDGIPLNLKFLGVFDTVESVGMAGTNKLPELIKTKVPAFVQKCTHIVAAHELRDAFPLTVVDGAHRCVVYPGAHADVGGGYAAQEQGRSDKLARMALLQMLDEARGAGLKMRSLGEMKAHELWSSRFRPSFDVPDQAYGALKRYMAAINPRGSLGQHLQAHMSAYWTWIDSGQAYADVRTKLQANPRQRERQGEYQRMAHMLNCLARTPAGRGVLAQPSSMPGFLVAPPPIADFFSSFVHDSFQHFSATGGTLQTDMSNADYYQLRTIRPPVG